MANTNHQTQWAGQFGVAHELTRRGYLVTFTMGNAPAADLLCKSPMGCEFSVQVKSLKGKNYFLYQESLLKKESNLYFVFVLVPPVLPNCKPITPEYFVLSKKQFVQLNDEETQRLKALELKRGKPYAPFAPGIYYTTLKNSEYLNAWNNLPD